jgi:hypothetical protein
MHLLNHLPHRIALIAGACFAVLAPLAAQQTIIVNVTGTKTTKPLTSFSGVNLELMSTGSSYLDTNLQPMAAQLYLGWTRFPAGTATDGFDYTNGVMPDSMVSQFYANYPTSVAYTTMQTEQQIVYGKGKLLLNDYATFTNAATGTTPIGASSGSNSTLKPHTIGVVNVFTDTTTTAAKMVTDALNNTNLVVDYWELGNEPTYFTSGKPGWSGGQAGGATNYLNAVAKFATAMRNAATALGKTIKLAVWIDNPNPDDTYAPVAPATTNTYNLSPWNQSVVNYAAANGTFWDALYTHSYPHASNHLGANGPAGAAADTATNERLWYYGWLDNQTNSMVDNQLAAAFGANWKTLEFSELNSNDSAATQMEALFISEYLIRMSSDLSVTNMGINALVGAAGGVDPVIGATNGATQNGLTTSDQVIASENACSWAPISDPMDTGSCASGFTPIHTYDTSKYAFGYFMEPSGIALQLVDPVINTATGFLTTNVVNNPQITELIPGQEANPAVAANAIYAQGYINGTGATGTTQSLLLTNRDSVPYTVTIHLNGYNINRAMTTVSFGGLPTGDTEPSQVKNSLTSQLVTLTTATVPQGTNTVTIPAFGVMSVSWIK